MTRMLCLFAAAAALPITVVAHDIPFEHTHNDDGTYTVEQNGFVVSDVDVTQQYWNPRGKSANEIEARVQFVASKFDPPRSAEDEALDQAFREKYQGAVVINSLLPSAAGFVGVKDEHFVKGIKRNDAAGITLTSATVMAFSGSADSEDVREPVAKTNKVLSDLDYDVVFTIEEVREYAENGQMAVMYNTQDSGQLTGIPIDRIDPNDPLKNISTEEIEQALIELEDGMNWALESGIKTMNFAYNETNAIGGGGNQQHNGVTKLGEAFVRMANERGIVVDCSHSSDKVCIEMAKVSSLPVMASHSNVKALLDANRNMSDEAIVAVGDTGGVVCTNGVGLFLAKDGSASPEVFAEHVVYTAKLIGRDKTCFASDYLHNYEDFLRRNIPQAEVYAPENGWAAPTENTTVEQIWAVARILHEEYGWNDEEVRGFLGENLMRVYEANWK